MRAFGERPCNAPAARAIAGSPLPTIASCSTREQVGSTGISARNAQYNACPTRVPPGVPPGRPPGPSRRRPVAHPRERPVLVGRSSLARWTARARVRSPRIGLHGARAQPIAVRVRAPPDDPYAVYSVRQTPAPPCTAPCRPPPAAIATRPRRLIASASAAVASPRRPPQPER